MFVKGLSVNPQPVEARLAHLEGAFVQVADRLNSIDRRLDTIENVMQSRFGQLEQGLNSRFNLIDQRFTWMIGLMVGTWITTILTVLFHH
jgi:tetrahydromethanopterin S-methyltransferase subunit G